MKTEIREELESYVIAWNKNLKEVVHNMDYPTLLRNAHPTYRSVYAAKLLELKLITKDEANEFLISIRG
jgi:hypothetical protein